MYKLHDLAQILQTAGLKCDTAPGAETRGHGDFAMVKGVLCHHTAGCLPTKAHEEPSLQTVIQGRPAPDRLLGPLCNLYLDPEGKWVFVAAGTAYHAGWGSLEPQGVPKEKAIPLGGTANAYLIGIEAENTGLPNDPWPEAQLEAYAKGCAALLDHYGLPTAMCAGHKEFARSFKTGKLGRKTDPDFDMDKFRQRIDSFRKHTNV